MGEGWVVTSLTPTHKHHSGRVRRGMGRYSTDGVWRTGWGK